MKNYSTNPFGWSRSTGTGPSRRCDKLLKTLLVFAILLAARLAVFAQGGTPVHSITTGSTTLTIRSFGPNNYGVGIQLGATYYEQAQPCAVEVVTSGGQAAWLTGPYSSVQDLGNSTYRCTGTQTSANGSVFTFTDTYSLYSFGCFEVDRNVTVTSAQSGDAGFSTMLTFAEDNTSSMNDFDFFAPGIWYKDNANVSDVSLATDFNDYYYWFREDRMPLPIFMLRNKLTGVTFSVGHLDPDGSTFTGEDGLNRVIDGRMKFASMGMQNNNQPSVGILYPGSEGERTGIYGMSSTKRWALRSHPVTQGYAQDYTLAMRLYYESDFPTAMKNTWIAFYNIFNPPLYNCDLTRIYLDQLALLDTYWQSINGAPGFPFRVLLNGNVEQQTDYNFNMGFVGMQIPNAAILLREGINANNPGMISKAEQTIDWWVDNALTSTGCPRTWYDASPQTWSSIPTFTRVVGDGMLGMLWAWNFEKKRGVDKVNWLNACYRVANWLLSKQNGDGSFPRAWDYNTGNVVFSEKTNTSHVIPFLVDMYKVTGNNLFRDAAIDAGNYVYNTNYLNFDYIGGTPDNPNVPDKEAASMALRAFLALYDANGDPKWLDAAKQTVYYYETWVYSWNVPIPADDPNATYPKDRSTTGLSLIATGQNGADSYAAIDAFSFYRMYLYTGDPHLLQMSRLLLRNTKQVVNWDRNDPIPGYGEYGILQEAMNVTIPRGHSVGYYLPWQTYNLIEPMVLFWDTFNAGTYSISSIDNLSNKHTLHSDYSASRNFVSSESESIVNDGIYIIVNRNSGKVLDVAGSSANNGANIQQWEYNGTDNQQWKVVDAGSGYKKLIARHSNKVIDVEGFSLNNGANISQYTDSGTDNQLWSIVGVGGGYWKIVNKNSGKVIDVEGFSQSNGANISQYTDSGTRNQQWLFVRVDDTGARLAESIDRGSEKPEPTVSIYPSLVSDFLKIDKGDNQVKLLEIYSITGEIVQDLSGFRGDQVDVSQLAKGVYFIHVIINGHHRDVKFIKR